MFFFFNHVMILVVVCSWYFYCQIKVMSEPHMLFLWSNLCARYILRGIMAILSWLLFKSIQPIQTPIRNYVWWGYLSFTLYFFRFHVWFLRLVWWLMEMSWGLVVEEQTHFFFDDWKLTVKDELPFPPEWSSAIDESDRRTISGIINYTV